MRLKSNSMSRDFKIVIPVRYDSTRFPGKAMAGIDGKPMIEHVFNCAQKTQSDEIIIATDSDIIAVAAEEFGASVCMTSTEHHSGTDRIAEVADTMGWADNTVVVNLQGDEPMMPAAVISQVATNLIDNKSADCATLYAQIENSEDVNDPNVVKVITDNQSMALYFSRSTIPYHRDTSALVPVYKRHIGMYAYRAGMLKTYKNLDECELEVNEKLEQLRLLYNGLKIHVGEACTLPGPGVDTADDLEKVKALLAIEKSSTLR